MQEIPILLLIEVALFTLVTENVYTQTVSTQMVSAMGRIEKAYGKEAKKRTSKMHRV